jgi:endonuclease YncB( thermonuclease family)
MGHRFLIVAFVTSTLLISDLEAGQPKPPPRPAPSRPPVPPPVRRQPDPVRPDHSGGANNGAGNNGRSSGEHPRSIYHINPNGPQKTPPVLKTFVLKNASKVERHLHNSNRLHHWHQNWVWGVYAYLPAYQTNTVVGVPTGNSVAVSNGIGTVQRVRLAGVGAPMPGQALFSESRENLDGIANGQHVRVFQVGIDPDGAIVGQVFLDSGEYVNAKQISQGMAWYAVDDSLDDNLAAAEQGAQGSALGMWGGDYSAAY